MIATTRFFTTAAIFSLLFGAALAGAEEIVPLEKLDLTQMTAGFKQPQPNREVTGRPLQIRGKRFKNGVGTHANSKFRVDLHKQAKRFTATVGVDDTAKGNGSVEFLVLGDGRELWKSGVLTRKDGAKPVSVNLTGVGALELRVTDARDGTSDDRADWADAKLALQDGARQPEALPPHQTIALRTKTFQMVFEVGDDDRLYQRVLGGPGEPKTKDHRRLEAYPQAGDGYMWEPALEVVHADGNTSTHLVFENATRTDQGSRGQVTRIQLQDSAYPLKVALCFRIFPDRDVIEQWSEIKNNERKPVRLERMASTSLLLAPEHLTLTHFYGGWANEMIPATEELTDGIKIVDSKMGTRTAQDRSPSFILSLDGPPVETRGRVLAGSLAWSGNFQCAFERLGAETRALCGVNPFASSYDLDAGKTFTTPPIIWVWSNSGLGEMSRKLHSWARDFGVRDGHQPRAVLLNNWEATKFDFDFNRIASLFHPAKQLGFELFLLDDGWFGNKYPRVNDRAGLGDWQPNRARLPGGLAPLAAAAEKDGLRFGIWIEPEMVNPKSDLYDRHPNWVIRQPKRDLDFQRNQLVLDLTRPAVQ
ncbi:MAG TPA: alpha-galactosidase, partial [Verrucomicrobiae bacterium]|nr:alpha-galactosidase [Verrucomicrobiae bacterium]